MSHTVEYDPEENMVIAKVMGKVGLPDLLECIANILRVAKQENCIYILTDLHEATLEVSVSQIFSLSDTIGGMAKEQGMAIHAFKRVFIAAKGQDILKLYENASVNRNHNTKLFHDIEEAKSWLREGMEKRQ